ICYSTWIFSVIFDGPMEIPIPKVNTPAYRVHENASNPDSPMIVQLNQTLTANYTGFSFHTLGENMFTNYTMDYTTERQTDFALMFAIIFSGVTATSLWRWDKPTDVSVSEHRASSARERRTRSMAAIPVVGKYSLERQQLERQQSLP
ncbi:hypothetical protein ANCDUO_25622, partial [Ancylostoma duodenale]